MTFTATTDVQSLPQPPVSSRVTRHGSHWSLFTHEPDEIVRWLVHQDVGFRQLSIEALDLGDAIDELVLQQASGTGVRS